MLLSSFQKTCCGPLQSIFCRVLLHSIENCAVFIGCLKPSFRCVSHRRLPTHAHISISCLSTSTLFFFYIFYTIVALVLSINTDIFQNSLFCKLSLPVSQTNERPAETSFNVSRISICSKYSTCTRSTICSAFLHLLVAYSSNITSAQSLM